MSFYLEKCRSELETLARTRKLCSRNEPCHERDQSSWWDFGLRCGISLERKICGNTLFPRTRITDALSKTRKPNASQRLLLEVSSSLVAQRGTIRFWWRALWSANSCHSHLWIVGVCEQWCTTLSNRGGVVWMLDTFKFSCVRFLWTFSSWCTKRICLLNPCQAKRWAKRHWFMVSACQTCIPKGCMMTPTTRDMKCVRLTHSVKYFQTKFV